jgi:hypothetical protein
LRRRFSRFACFDWSGASGPVQPGIALAVCAAGTGAPVLVSPPGRHWSREAVLAWLLAQAEAEADMLIGLDFSAALPFDPGHGYVPGAPRTAKALWAYVERVCAADPHLGARSFAAHADHAPFYRAGGVTGARFSNDIDRNGRLRLVERRPESGHATSSFNLVGAAQVGLSSLTGMRVLHRLAGKIPVWPFDPVPAKGPLIVEVYTSIAAVAAGRRRGASKMRDHAALDAALAALGSEAGGGLGPIDDHRSDALLTAAWLRQVAGDERLWHPRGIEPVRATEGWTFGVP